MKKLTLLFLIVAVGSGFAFAQDEAEDPNAWRIHAEASLGLTQSAYSDNWTGGEVGSIIWAANFHGTAEKQLSDRFKWENALRLEFGQTHSQDKDTKKWASPVKSTDKIRFDSILKFTLGGWADPYVAGVFESQFYDATYSPAKEFYVNPIALTESAGASKTLLEAEDRKLATRLGLGLRQNIYKLYDELNDETSTESTYDGGIEWVTDLTRQFSETLSYTSKLTVFQALFYSEEDEEGIDDDWKATDVKWENLVTARVASIIQVSLAWELIYNKEVSTAGQFKETLALGVAWVL